MSADALARKTLACFEAYDRRFARAMADLPDRRPWTQKGRREIVRDLRACLGVRPGWVPRIRPEVVRVSTHAGFRVEHLRFESWPGVFGAAHLYLPGRRERGGSALVVLCCGHGRGAKLHRPYQQMARLIARCGAMVLALDNIGQGEREPMGHARPVAPFACGTTVQGLIVMETLAWVDWARRDGRVDPGRLATVGNSGGGHLSALMAALCPHLAAVSSSGRPGTYEYTARKERPLCHCAILPGIVGRLEMWHVLGCAAPRPMYLFQGVNDRMFPYDQFRHCARKVRAVYERRGAPAALRAEALPGRHGWDAERMRRLAAFLVEALSLPNPDADLDTRERLLPLSSACLKPWPDRALDTDALAARLTGQTPPPGLALWDVFKPRDLPPLPPGPEADDTRRILAQFEAFLGPPPAS